MAAPFPSLIRALRVARLRLRSLVDSRRLDAEIDDELAFHAAMAEEAARARGLEPAAARLEARRRVDGAALRRDEMRDARGFAWLDALRQDLRHAWRGLRRTPVYTGVAIASLGLGLGAAASLVAVVDAVLVRPLPLPDASRVVWIDELRNGEPSGGSPARLADWQRLRAVSAAGGYYTEEPYVRAATGDFGRIPALRTFGSLFDVIGLTPIVGRLPTPAEQRAAGAPVVLLTERAWRTRFGARRDVAGSRLRVDRVDAEIIGVLPDAVEAVTEAELWMPASPDLQASSRQAGFLGQIARLGPRQSMAAADAEFAAAARALVRAFPASDRGLGVRLVPLRTRLGQDARTPLLLLVATVGLVLLVVCLNVASLALARGLGRLRDASLRVAIGAGRARLVQLHLLESGLLAALGAASGTMLAWFGVDLLRAVLPATPGLASAAVDGRVVAAMAALGVGCSLIVGVLPAAIAWRSAAAPTLRDGGYAVSGAARSRMRSVLVVAQVAAAVVLLVGAGLLARALGSLSRTPLGFQPAHVMTFGVPLPWDTDFPKIAAVTTRVLDRLEAAPGVRAAGVVDRLPLGGGSQTTPVLIDGVALSADLAGRDVAWRTASRDYFPATGIPLRRGELVPARWTPDAPRVAVVNERFVRLFLAGRDPIGLMVAGHNRSTQRSPRYRIVGVVGDVRATIDESAPMPAVYVPAGATFWPLLNFAARVDGDPASLLPTIRALGRELAPDVTIESVATMEARVSEALGEPRARMWIVTAFAGVTLLLAAIGLYGLLAGEVAGRVREIGIRLTLGAAPAQILAHTLRRGLALTLIGAAIGLAASPLVARVIEGLLAGRSPSDGVAFGGALAVLLVAALLASLGPAWRAARIDPNRALRTD
jgi:predicted permease